MSAEALLPVGLKNGFPVLISEIPLEDIGKNCGCVCPNCGGPLVAKTGPFRRRHFSHTSVDCSFRTQDATRIGLLYIAESILHQEMKLRVPGFYISDDRVETYRDDPEIYLELNRRYQVARPEMLAVTEVRLEKGSEGTDPILIVETECGRIVMDIVIKHHTRSRSRNLPLNCGYSVIEIDVSKAGCDGLLNRDRLRTLIIHDTQYKKWLHNSRFAAAPFELSQSNDKVVQGIREQRKAP